MSPDYSRREFVGMVGGASAAMLLLGGCAGGSPAARIGPHDADIEAAEAMRRQPGAMVRDLALTAAPFTLGLGALNASTWAYNGAVPTPEVRVNAGDVIRARFRNDLPEPTTVHWHGIRLRNDMDGVAGVTQDPVAPGGEFTYEFTVPDAGTFWFHPHVGLQLDRGLYGALIVEDPDEPDGYSSELVIVLDDWTSGIGQEPESTLTALREGGGAHGDHDGAAPGSDALKGPGGDVVYPLYLVNGRPPSDPTIFVVTPGERLRLRVINAASDTPFRFAVGEHALTVTHTDGFPVEPVTVDSVLIGMGERYDMLVTVAGLGSFPVVAVAEGKGNQAFAVLRAGGAQIALPEPSTRPVELDRRLLALSDLKATPAAALPTGEPDRAHRVVLEGGTDRYRWTINGRSAERAKPLEVRAGERVRLRFDNRSAMFHPMHLHGHSFQVSEPVTGGARKDTLIVLPAQQLAVDFIADNPGQWVLHCHNAYHQVGGMETIVSYVR